MSTNEDHEDLKPTTTPGYRPSAAKTVEEYAKLDAEDESLARWKASLGIVGDAPVGPATGPKLTVLTLELCSNTLPQGKTIILDVQNKAILADTKKNPIVIKEGVKYNVRITFRVNHSLVTGLRYIHLVRRGIIKDKLEEMLGSYPARAEPYTKDFESEESPSGMIARAGNYTVKSRVIDDDGEAYDWEWSFTLEKEW